MSDSNKDKVLEIRDLDISFKTDNGEVKAVRGVDLDLHRGETIAIVGESGSGKSVTTKAVMGILAGNGTINKGSINFTYFDLNKEHLNQVLKTHENIRPEDLNPEEIVTVDITKKNKKFIQKEIRGRRIAMVFQDPMTSLDPTMTIGKQVMEAMMFHYNIPKQEAYKRAVELLKQVGITDAEARMKNYPHQLSGGMRQRVVIAIALSCDPEVLICDEPTTALDVTIQAKILELIKKIQKEKNLSVIYITHDLGVVAKVADFVNVMYAGRIVESGTVNDIFYDPKHPYTWGLLASMPDVDSLGEELYTIPGTPPNLLYDIPGDAFAPRNRYALKIDEKVQPPMFQISDTHAVASWLASPLAPEVNMPEDLQERMVRMKEEAVQFDPSVAGIHSEALKQEEA